MSYDIGEIERIIASMLRIGTIAAVDLANARVQVTSGDLSTDWIPWGTQRAGGTVTWSVPRVGEQMMIFAPGGDPSQAVAGMSLYQAAQPAPANLQEVEHTLFPDGSTLDYNSASNTYTLTITGNGNFVVNCKNATINAQTQATIATETATVNASTSATVTTATATINASTSANIISPVTNVSQDLNVGGNVSIAGSLGVVGTSNMTGNMTTSGNVTVNGATQVKSITSNGKDISSMHTHGGVQTGGGTTGTVT